MKLKRFYIIGAVAILLVSAGVWYFGFRTEEKQERKVLYWTDPMIPGYKSPTPGKSPMGMEMIPVYEDSALGSEAEAEPSESQEGHEHEGEIDYYTCTMHPSVKEKQPGKCPICSMDLVPVLKKPKASTGKVDLSFSVSPVKQQLIGVKFSTAEVQALEQNIRAVGRVDFDERKVAVVNLKISGWIGNLYVDYTGRFVEKGQPLFAIYSPELVSTQEEYLLALRALKEQRLAATTSNPASLNSTISISNEEVLQRARERLLLWDLTEEQIAELERQGEPETYVTIPSPLDGYVINKTAFKGMHVEPGMQLYKIANLSNVWVYADVYEYELPFVKVGQEATVSLSYFPGEAFRGRITYIFPYLNANTRTVRVRIEFPNRNGKLKPEMYANVEIRVNLGRKLAVPENAIMNTGKRQIVFVDKGSGLFDIRFVKLGARANGLYEIQEGLQPGERVVSYANFLIDAESKVQGVLQRMEIAAAREQTQETKHKENE